MSDKSQKLPVVQNAKVKEVEIISSPIIEYLITIKFDVEYYDENDKLIVKNIFENINIPDQDFKTVIHRLLYVFYDVKSLSDIVGQYVRIYLDEYHDIVCIKHIFDEHRAYNIRAMFPDNFNSEPYNPGK